MFTTRPPLRGTSGMVASMHGLASSVGLSVLLRALVVVDGVVVAVALLRG